MTSPVRIYTRDEVRSVDQTAIEDYGVPGIVLMENAARNLAHHTLTMLENIGGRRVLILCGSGNNAGDGLAAARHLHNADIAVTIALTRPEEKFSGDAETNFQICRAMDLPLVDASENSANVLEDLDPHDLILDALLGTGLDSDVRSPQREVIDWLNTQDTAVLAVDIPSGLDCDTGEPLGTAVRAAETVTFVGWKVGFKKSNAAQYTGRVTVADIGAPKQAVTDSGFPARARPTSSGSD